MPRRKYYRRRKSGSNGTLLLVIFLLIVAANSNASSEGVQQLFVAAALFITLILAGLLFFRQWKRQGALQKLRALQMVDIDIMDGLEFEKFVVKLLENRGYRKVRLTERYDYGIDIVAVKEGVTWGVQVKRYRNMVRAEAVRQVVTALNKYKCQRAMVVTNSTFSRPAKVLAETNNCVLIGKDQLAEWIIAFQQGE